MRSRNQAHPLLWVGVLLPLCLAAQPRGVDLLGPGLDRTTVPLSGTVRVTLAVEGPAPLRVELAPEPDKLLAPVSAAAWRIRPDGPAKVTPLPEEGRERWEQAFRLDPYLAGETVPLAFAPVKVTAGTDLNPREETFPPKEVRVVTSVAEAKAEAARPVTGIEELPPLPPPNPATVGWQVAAALAAVFAAAVAAAVVRRWRAKPPPLPPGEWAARELDRLERAGTAGRELADRLAAVLRGYVERRYGLPAPQLTTAELLAESRRAGWPEEAAAPLRDLLERCDRAKFAGDAPGTAEAGDMLRRAREWVVSSSPPAAAGGL